MEFFSNGRIVRLKSHLDKYLIADEDRISTRQGVADRRSRWTVEIIDDQSIRLKSCHDRYLTAADDSHLLGINGHKVIQTFPKNPSDDFKTRWQPIRDGFQVKLKSFKGSYLQANGGAPPWRSSVTHDRRLVSGTQNWVLWDVEEIELPEEEATAEYWSMVTTFSSLSDEISGLDFDFGSPVSTPRSTHPPPSSPPLARSAGMDLFRNAKAVRLKNVHGKYLTADEDEESVTQDRNGSSTAAKWTAEFLPESDSIIRLKSCYGKYLTASNQSFLLGLTGHKVLQTLPKRLDSSVEWEPVREHGSVKLKTRYGQFLRANGGLPPWRNSVTHDIPHRTATQDWILWDVHVVEILDSSPAAKPPPVLIVRNGDSLNTESSSPNTSTSSFSRQESMDSFVSSPPKCNEGRVIYFRIADETGEVDQVFEEMCIQFKGNDVTQLTKSLETELGINGVTVCSKSPLNGKLYPLRLQLPPNNTTMHVVVLPP
ncbi:hypothetical protein M569_10939, partial [Genlisea aurea]